MTQTFSDDRQPVSASNPWTTVTRWLVVINCAVFLLDYFVIRRAGVVTYDGQAVTAPQPLLALYGHFSVYTAITLMQVWRFVTYQFVHANLEHIVLNMFGLLLAGPLVEQIMGRGKYLAFYLTCGIAGPIAHLLLSQLHLTQLNYFTPLVGASASIYGVLVAAAVMAPDELVMLAFPPIDIRLRTFVLLMIGLSLAAVLWKWQNAGGHAAHLGGAVVGYVLSRRYRNRAVLAAPG